MSRTPDWLIGESMVVLPYIDEFRLTLDVQIRPATTRDVPVLEWWGQYFAHRRTIEDTFEAQTRGDAVMLVAEVNGCPAGQAWINLKDSPAATIWAVRVFPLLQGCGIGSRLMSAAETYLVEHGFEAAQLTVEKDNTGARRFYERHGYEVDREVEGSYTFRPPGGEPVTEPQNQWVMRKRLSG
jgi:ribosomal protein S18 acetylase RimI-like enzyme